MSIGTQSPTLGTMLTDSTPPATSGSLTPPILIAQGVLVAQSPALTITATWDNAAVQFETFLITITDTASLASSQFVNFSLNGTTTFAVQKNGAVILGAAPVISAGLNIDNASYTNSVSMVNGAVAGIINVTGGGLTIRTTSNDPLNLGRNGVTTWIVSGSASTSVLIANQTTAQIIGGATNGLAIRNSGNTRNNFSIVDAGQQAVLNDGTNSIALFTVGAFGELVAGGGLEATSGTMSVNLITESVGTTSKVLAGYWDGAQYRSAWEIQNIVGFGTLSLMKSGGGVAIGANGSTTAGLTIQNAAIFDQSAVATQTRMQVYTVDTGTMQRVQTITNAAILTLLGLGAGRLLYVPA